MSLIENEIIYEKALGELQSLASGEIGLDKKTTVLKEVQSVAKDWDMLLNTSTLSSVVSKIIKKINSAKDDEEVIRYLKILDFLLGPLEYYMIALEEMKSVSYRDAVTRCGMVCERFTHKLLLELGASNLVNAKVNFDAKIGRLKNELSERLILFGPDFCAIQSSVYNIRNRKGPHDVPVADEIEAKHCVGTIPMLYSRYLEILVSLDYDISDINQELSEFVNNLISFGTILPTVGKGGVKPTLSEILLDIYRQGFFAAKKTLKDVADKIGDLGYGFPKGSIHNALYAFHKKRILIRQGRRGNFTYAQKIPPQTYFNEV